MACQLAGMYYVHSCDKEGKKKRHNLKILLHKYFFIICHFSFYFFQQKNTLKCLFKLLDSKFSFFFCWQKISQGTIHCGSNKRIDGKRKKFCQQITHFSEVFISKTKKKAKNAAKYMKTYNLLCCIATDKVFFSQIFKKFFAQTLNLYFFSGSFLRNSAVTLKSIRIQTITVCFIIIVLTFKSQQSM